jgi:hypothetical protein
MRRDRLIRLATITALLLGGAACADRANLQEPGAEITETPDDEGTETPDDEETETPEDEETSGDDSGSGGGY